MCNFLVQIGYKSAQETRALPASRGDSQGLRADERLARVARLCETFKVHARGETCKVRPHGQACSLVLQLRQAENQLQREYGRE